METGQEEVETERQENETQNDEENDVVLVEKAYLYLTDGSYPEGATKNDKRSIRRKAGRLNIRDADTWRYEDGEHSATPPFSVLGVAAEPYMS